MILLPDVTAITVLADVMPNVVEVVMPLICGRLKATVVDVVTTLRGQDHQRPPGGTQDKDQKAKKSGIIYRYKCDRVKCNEEYIGESAKTFGERFKEHLKAPSPIYDHFNTTGHTTTRENFSIVGREAQNLMRLIK